MDESGEIHSVQQLDSSRYTVKWHLREHKCEVISSDGECLWSEFSITPVCLINLAFETDDDIKANEHEDARIRYVLFAC